MAEQGHLDLLHHQVGEVEGEEVGVGVHQQEGEGEVELKGVVGLLEEVDLKEGVVLPPPTQGLALAQHWAGLA